MKKYMIKQVMGVLLIFGVGYGAVMATRSLSSPKTDVPTSGDISEDRSIDTGDPSVICQTTASISGDYQGEPETCLSYEQETIIPLETDLSLENDAIEAVFLGVADYGKPGTIFANADDFLYCFLIDGAEQLYTISNTEKGDTPYPVQNLLKVNYHFLLTAEGDEIISVQEIEKDLPSYMPPVSGQPGERTLCNLLKTAMEPVGTTLYMFGGGWNWQDDGSGWQTRSIGVQLDWVRFYQEHDQSYSYRTNDSTTTYYPYGEFNQYYYTGLDCSGFVGWVVYNTLHSENGLPGYVNKSTRMAKSFADYGWGSWTHDVTTSTVMRPGDIMSINGHVWLSLGTCSDGSIVIVHSIPSDSYSGQPGGGVQIGAIGDSISCEAYQLAFEYMNRYYPDWCSRYKVTLQSKNSYLAASVADTGRFTWNYFDPLTDPDSIQNMSASQVLALLFNE